MKQHAEQLAELIESTFDYDDPTTRNLAIHMYAYRADFHFPDINDPSPSPYYMSLRLKVRDNKKNPWDAQDLVDLMEYLFNTIGYEDACEISITSKYGHFTTDDDADLGDILYTAQVLDYMS